MLAPPATGFWQQDDMSNSQFIELDQGRIIGRPWSNVAAERAWMLLRAKAGVSDYAPLHVEKLKV